MCAEIAAVLAGFVPGRDAGLFHYLGVHARDPLPAETRLLCSVVAMLGVPDPHLLQAVYTYIVELCVACEAFAKEHGGFPATPAAVIDACSGDIAHPLHPVLVRFVRAWRKPAEASLAAGFDLLLDRDTGFWLRLAGHSHAAADAERLLSQSLRRSPGHCLSWLQLAHLLIGEGRTREAAQAAHRAAALEPDHAEVQAQVLDILARAAAPAVPALG